MRTPGGPAGAQPTLGTLKMAAGVLGAIVALGLWSELLHLPRATRNAAARLKDALGTLLTSQALEDHDDLRADHRGLREPDVAEVGVGVAEGVVAATRALVAGGPGPEARPPGARMAAGPPRGARPAERPGRPLHLPTHPRKKRTT